MIKHKSLPKIFVAGTILLDIVSTIKDPRHRLDSLGVTSLTFGGVAYNTAINFRQLGSPVSLMTGINTSPLSQTILNELTNKKINVHLHPNRNLEEAIYSGHFLNGKEISSVWNNILEKTTFDKRLIKAATKNCDYAILTNCLNIDSLNNCIHICNKLKIPVFLSGTTPLESPKFSHLTGEIESIFINQEEGNYLLSSIKGSNTLKTASKELNTKLIVTKESNGAEMFEPNGQHHVFNLEKIHTTHTPLGAGDIFMSTYIFEHYFQKQPIVDSMYKAFESVPKVLNHTNANIDTPKETHNVWLSYNNHG